MRILVFVVTCTLLLGSVTALAGDFNAEEYLTVDGQIRFRTEMSRKAFSNDVDPDVFTDLRSRIGLKARVSDNVTAYFQLQDSRRLGGVSGNATLSGTTTSGSNVDVHQALVQIDGLGLDALGFKAGRFEVLWGNQRVFGSVGWNNVGRTWEGLNLWYDRPCARFSVYWLQLLESSTLDIVRPDAEIFAGTIDFHKLNTQVFVVAEEEVRTAPVVVSDGADRFTVGGYTRQRHDRFDLDANAAFQFGQTADGDDIFAYLLTGELGYLLDPRRETRLAVGFDLSSGDGDDADDEYEAYNNLYYTGHKFRGYMDYFLASESYGLLDIMLRARTKLADGWRIEADFHYFQAAEEYEKVTYAGTISSKDVGSEIDLTVTTTTIPGIVFNCGLSAFLPSEDFAGVADPDPGFWGYVQGSVKF